MALIDQSRAACRRGIRLELAGGVKDILLGENDPERHSGSDIRCIKNANGGGKLRCRQIWLSGALRQKHV